ncbi:MAG: hypothetical protein WBM37_04365, partial [Nitrososphaeraceae archaeon]
MSSPSSSSPTSMTTTIRKGSPSPSPSPLLDRKIDEAAAGLTAAIAKQLHSIGEDNAATIVKYVGAIKSEVNPANQILIYVGPFCIFFLRLLTKRRINYHHKVQP